MTVHLRAHSVSLELPLDMQRLDSGTRLSGFKATLGGSERLYRKVLKNINFSAEEGDRIGVLGLNGAGKTTLLRVLNGAFPPTQGRIERRGNTQSLLNPMLGFAEYASLIENVILRGTAMGLRRRQLDQALPEILEFAGLADCATHRLHTLSSGQRMRLGFAISTAIQPDILLMDEWIATGDAAFIKRAQDRLKSRVHGSRIVVVASHSTSLMRSMCTKALVLDQGKLRFFGDMAEGLEHYKEIIAANSSSHREAMAADPLLFGESKGMVEKIQARDGTIEIEGWAAGSKDQEVAVVCVHVGEHRRVFEKFERIDRADVRLHLAKRSGHYGFRIRVPVEADWPVANIGQLRISAGVGAVETALPVPVASSATVEF